jgi:TDG/mug DNA glycosylase family protein
VTAGGHAAVEDWMGEPVETLADLLRPGLRAVIVGFNPSPVSVAAGHYYQGRLGRLFLRRLAAAGVIPPAPAGREDDVAFAAGIGFTDLVKRPTPRAGGVRRDEIAHGGERLEAKLAELRPGLVIFTFKATARALFGPFEGSGFVPGLAVGETEAFVMPGPYSPAGPRDAALALLAARIPPAAADAGRTA